VLAYAVVSAETEKAVELFLCRADAERMLAEAIADEPEWRDVLSVEEVDLGGASDPAA
jgi:hypothetical protein